MEGFKHLTDRGPNKREGVGKLGNPYLKMKYMTV